MTMRLTRRSLLGGIGAGTAGIFGRPFAGMGRSWAQAAAPVKRFLVLYLPNASIKSQWIPTGGRTDGAGDATQFTLKNCNATLEPVREYLTIIDGLDLPRIGGDPHGSGIIRLTTGGTIRAGEGARDPGVGTLGTGNLPLLPSIDQVLEERSPLLKGPAFRSLQLAADSRSDDGRTDIHLRVMSYDTKLAPMAPDLEPIKTFARVFAGVAPGGSTPDNRAAIQRAVADDRSVLDFIRSDLDRLQGRLGSDQRPKLESHLEAVREFERTLARAEMGAAAGGTPATLPSAPPATRPNTNANHKLILDQFFGLTKLAFQLDLTRVITYMFGTGNSQVGFGGFLPGYSSTGLHPLAHNGNAGALSQATRWYCDTVATFVKDLAATPDIDGSSLLDNTIVALASEVGQFHDHNNIPFVLFGGKNLGLTGGRCLRYSGRTPSDVWVAVANAFGVPLTTFGDPQYSTGALPELFT
jgi:hypothetical protein